VKKKLGICGPGISAKKQPESLTTKKAFQGWPAGPWRYEAHRLVHWKEAPQEVLRFDRCIHRLALKE